MWRILCKWGQYQGDFPKALFKMRISSVFATYLKDKMSKMGLRSEQKQKLMSDLHRRVQDKLKFRSVKVCDSFVFYLLQSPEAIHSFSTIIGEMSVVGVRKRMPKVDVERVCNRNDSVNMLQKIELFLSLTKLRMRLYAVKYVVGNEMIGNSWLTNQLSTVPMIQNDAHELRINSYFDFNNGTFKVIGITEQGAVQAKCLYGEQKNEVVIFEDITLVKALVTAKRGN
jgi:hypothetical protein